MHDLRSGTDFSGGRGVYPPTRQHPINTAVQPRQITILPVNSSGTTVGGPYVLATVQDTQSKMINRTRKEIDSIIARQQDQTASDLWKAPGLAQRFRKLASKWINETKHLSSVQDIAAHPAFKQILIMGDAILPLILNDLRRHPVHWLILLPEITEEDPISPEQRGRIDHMVRAWKKWGEQRGYAA